MHKLISVILQYSIEYTEYYSLLCKTEIQQTEYQICHMAKNNIVLSFMFE